MDDAERRGVGLHLKPGLRCARQPGLTTILQGERARPQAFYSPYPRSHMPSATPAAVPFRKWRCLACGFIYDEAEGWPEDGIAPGTRWEDIPAGWCCPECGARKDDFEMAEV